MIQVDVIESYEDFAALESNWNAIYHKDPEAQFFVSWAWLNRVFLDHADECRVLAVKSTDDDADYIGFFPIRLQTIWSRSQRRFRNEIDVAGTLHWGQYNGFVCDPNREQDVLSAFANQLKKMHWAQLVLRYFHASDRRLMYFLNQFSGKPFEIMHKERRINNGAVNTLICPYVDLPHDYEAYLQILSANTRQKIRRFARMFENSDDLHITMTNGESLQKDLDILVELWTMKWAPSKGDETEEAAQRYRHIVQHAFEANVLHMPILWRGDTPLGIVACFVDWQKPSMYFFVTGRNLSSEAAFTGWLLHTHNIRWAIDHGIKRYDFLQGDEAYKYSYGCQDRVITYSIVQTRSRVNLNGMLDPACVEEVMRKTARYVEQDRLERAKTACQQVLEIDMALANKKGMAKDHTILGNIHLMDGELDQAEVHYRSALVLHGELDNQESLGRIYGNLGNIHKARDELVQAEESYHKALALYEAFGNKPGMARAYSNLGNIHKMRGEMVESKVHWKTALSLCEQAGMESEMKQLQQRIDGP